MVSSPRPRSPLRAVSLVLMIPVPLLMGVSALRSWREVLPVTGLTLREADQRVIVERVAPNSPAATAGIEPGTVILKIAGKPVRSRLVAEDRLRERKAGRPIGMQIETAVGPKPIRIPGAAQAIWYPERVIAAVVGFVFYLAAITVWTRRRQGALSTVYTLWCLAGALMLGVSWSSAARTIDWVLYWSDGVGRLLFPSLLLHWTVLLASRSHRVRRWVPLLYSPVMPLGLTELYVALGAALRSSTPVASFEFLRHRLEFGWIVIALAGSFVLLFRALRRTRDASQQARARWVLVGAAIGIVPFLLTSGLWQSSLGVSRPLEWFSLPLLAVAPIALTGAVLEYRLMDLSLFSRRAVTVMTTLGLAVVVFLGLNSLVQLLLRPWAETNEVLSSLVAAAVTVSLSPTIKAITRDLIGRLYYRRRYSFRRALEHVARDLNAERDLPRLVDRLRQRVQEALDAGEVQVLFVDADGALRRVSDNRTLFDRLDRELLERLEQGETLTMADIPLAPQSLVTLHQLGVQWILPLRVENSLIAVLAVGPRPGAGLLDSDDRDLLRSVAAHAAAAVAAAHHLAELKQQMSLVEQLRAHTESVIESSPIGIAVVDAEGLVRHWNSSLESLLSLPRTFAIGRTFHDVLPESIAQRVQSALSGVPSRAFRVRIGSRGTPTDRYVNLTVGPLQGESQAGVLLTLDEVTEQVQMEERLIQQDRLASVGMLAAGVAHEVNTPLTGISSFAQLLLEEAAPNSPQRSTLEKIVQQAGRAARIARDLLRLSRPVAAVGELSSSPVVLSELVEETLGLLMPQIRRAGVVIEREWNPSLAPAWGDRSRLQQVLMNLVLNALDAVGESGTIQVRLIAEGARHVALEVVDDGPGIPDAVRSRIFDPFFTTKKAGAGTGLGLSISYAIVREHGGVLSAESRPGGGTTMRVVLPAAASVVADSRAS